MYLRRSGFLSCVAATVGAFTVPLVLVERVEAQDLETRMQQIEDREAIRALLLSYGRALDAHDFVRFVSLFSEDGEWVNGSNVYKGREAIFEFMNQTIGHNTPNEPLTYHLFLNNELIELDGDRASSTTNAIVVRQVPETGAPLWRFLSRYQDTFVKENGRWLFLRREAYTDIPAPR